MILNKIAHRIVVSIPVILGVLTVGFFLMVLVPADPAVIIAGDGASPEALAAIRTELGLDRPIFEQFTGYVARVARGDLGRSLVSSTSVISELTRTSGPTFELLLAALFITVPIGIGLGLLAAQFQGTIFDRLIMIFAAVGMSAPVFMTGLLLMQIIGVKFGLLPVQGRGGPLYTLDGIQHIILPAVTLAMTLIGPIARMTRASILDVIRKDFVRTARSKGIGERRVMIAHALRNALIPTVNLIGLQAGFLLGSIVVVETVFAWPGMGRLAVSSIVAADAAMAQGTMLFLALSFVLINLVVDVICGLIDPRSREA
jgi:glutathione transport system permease protein